MATTTNHKVTKADIEAKLREIRGEVDQTAEKATSLLLVAGAAAVVLVVGMSYLFGRRKGRKKSTVVEIRRV